MSKLINSQTRPEMVDCLTQSPRLHQHRWNYFLNLKGSKEHNFFDLNTPELLSREYGISADEVVKCIEAVEAMLELCIIVGFIKPRSRNWLRQHHHKLSEYDFVNIVRSNQVKCKAVHRMLALVSRNGEGSWVKFLKWKFAAYFAFHRNQDIPERPLLLFPLEGPKQKISRFFEADCYIGGWIDDQLNSWKSSSKKDLRLKFWQVVNTSQQLKKAMPAVPESMVVKSVSDTVSELTLDPDDLQKKQVSDGRVLLQRAVIDYGLIGAIPGQDFYVDLTRGKVVEALKRTTDELFSDVCLSYKDLFEPFFPSISANYIWSRGKCGALNELYQKTSFGNEGDLLQFGVIKCTFSRSVSEHYGDLGRLEQNVIDAYESVGLGTSDTGEIITVDTSLLENKWRKQYNLIFDIALAERPLVSAVGLSEPLKVRVISKGPPLTYTALKPLQTWLWSNLKKHKVFQLMGRYVEETDINRVLGRLQKNFIALSGDYVASTNKIHSWVSEVILDQLMINIGENLEPGLLHYAPDNFLVNLKDLMLRALTKHIFVEDGVEKPQTEGQLMGSIISFPFLCIANAALCRLAIEESEFNTVTYRVADHKVRLGKILPCLINGDDCLLKGHFQRLRICWEGFCAIAGLFSSLGKTYFSDNFCTINSTIFEWNETTQWWTECKYINLGLMRGQKRAGSGNQVSKFRSLKMGPHELGVICRELKRSCPDAFWNKVKKRFIHYNRETLDKYPLSWFLPEWLGGIGLPVDNESEVSILDRRFATVIKMKMNSVPKLKPVKPKDMAMWKMHQLVMQDLKMFNHVELPHYRLASVDDNVINLADQWARLYKLMTINLLEKTPLEKLVNEIEEGDSIHKALRHNCDVQAYARRELEFGNYEPMSLSDMSSENKDLVLPTWIREFDDFSALLGKKDD